MKFCRWLPLNANALLKRFSISPRSFSVFVTFILITVLANAAVEGPDEVYVNIYTTIERADALSQTGQSDLARAKYEQAHAQLLNLKRSDPTWNPKLVAFRLNYLAERITALSQTNAPDNTATPKPETKSETKKTAPLAAVQVKLLDAGAEPRRVLRLSPKAGETQRFGMTLKMVMGMGMGDAPGQPMKIPPVQTAFDVTAKSISANGDIAYQMVVTDVSLGDNPEAAPQIAEAMKASLASVKGLSSTGTMSNRGFNKGADIKLPPSADSQMRQSVEQMKETLTYVMSPLPEEAVGAGAKWEVEQPVKSQGMKFDQTATYQLTSIEGDRVSMTVAIVQHATNQKMQNPTMPAVKVDVTKMTGNGTGNVTLDLTHLLPLSATINSHTEMSMGMNVGSQKQNMTMKMDMDMRLEAKE